MIWRFFWRLGAWISTVAFLFLLLASILVFFAPRRWGFPQADTNIDWSFVPNGIVLPVWYQASLAFLPLGAAALVPGAVALFRKSTGKAARWLLAINLFAGSAVGLLLIVSATAIVAYRSVPKEMSIGDMPDEIVGGVLLTLILLFPTLYSCLLSTFERIGRHRAVDPTCASDADFRFVCWSLGVVVVASTLFFGGQASMWLLMRDRQLQITALNEGLFSLGLERTTASSSVESPTGIHPLREGESSNDVVDSVYGLTRMHIAARDGNIEQLQYLISEGGDVDVKSSGGRGVGGETPIHWAGNGQIVSVLVEQGADLSAPAPMGQTALMSLAFRNRLDAVRKMTELGADVNAKDDLLGMNSLGWACGGLATDGAFPDAESRYERRMELIRFLVAKGADVNAPNNDGETPLFTAVNMGEPRFIKLLVELGANIEVTNRDGKTLADFAKEFDNPTELLDALR